MTSNQAGKTPSQWTEILFDLNHFRRDRESIIIDFSDTEAMLVEKRGMEPQPISSAISELVDHLHNDYDPDDVISAQELDDWASDKANQAAGNGFPEDSHAYRVLAIDLGSNR